MACHAFTSITLTDHEAPVQSHREEVITQVSKGLRFPDLIEVLVKRHESLVW